MIAIVLIVFVAAVVIGLFLGAAVVLVKVVRAFAEGFREGSQR